MLVWVCNCFAGIYFIYSVVPRVLDLTFLPTSSTVYDILQHFLCLWHSEGSPWAEVPGTKKNPRSDPHERDNATSNLGVSKQLGWRQGRRLEPHLEEEQHKVLKKKQPSF